MKDIIGLKANRVGEARSVDAVEHPRDPIVSMGVSYPGESTLPSSSS